jgi:GNAT superfamily N-acetyltransferase
MNVWGIRAREERDLAAGGPLVTAVHDSDGYPVRPPPDPSDFLRVADALGAWVAEEDGDVVGHVLLRPSTSAPVMRAAARATGLPEDRLGVVGRLLVSPTARRRGLGRALLDVAASHAGRLGLHPVLDVVTGHRAAIAMYEAAGWRRADTVHVTFGDVRFEEFVYIAPRRDAAS